MRGTIIVILVVVLFFSKHLQSGDSGNIEIPQVSVRLPQVTAEKLKKAPVSMFVTFPYLGKIEIKAIQEPERRLEARIPSPERKIAIGPLVIDDGVLTFAQDTLTYTARGSVFGLQTRFGVREILFGESTEDMPLVIKRMVLGTMFVVKPILELFPGASATLESFDIILDLEPEKPKEVCAKKGAQALCEQPVKAVATMTLFGQKITVEFAFCLQGSRAMTKVNNLSLTKLFPFLDNTLLAPITFNLEFGFDNLFAILKQEDERKYEAGYGWYTVEAEDKLPRIRMCGSADLSKVTLFSQVVNANAVYCEGTLTSEELQFEIGLQTLDIKNFGAVKNARLIIKKKKDSKFPEAVIVGSTEIEIPLVGKVNTTAACTISEEGLTLAGRIDQPLTVKIDQTTFVLNEAKALVTSDREVAVKGLVSLKEPVRLQGQALLYTHITEDQQIALLLDCALPRKTRFSELIPGVEKDPQFKKLMDSFAFRTLRVIASSKQFKDRVLMVTIQQGLNLYSRVDISGVPELDNVRRLIFGKKTKIPSIILFAALGLPDPTESMFRLELPMPALLPPPVNEFFMLDTLMGEISGPTPKIGLGARIGFRPITLLPGGVDFQKEWMYANGKFFIEADKISCEASLTGMWNNVFGIRGVSIGDLGFRIGFTYETFPIPTTFGAAGKLAIGQKKFSTLLNVPPLRPHEMAIQGKLDGDQLCLEDLIDFFGTITGAVGQRVTIPTDQLPQICVKDVELSIAPRRVRIGDLEYDKGLKISGELSVMPPKSLAQNKPLFVGRGMFELRDTGIAAEGYLNEQSFGLLKITGAGPDKLYNTPDDGPYFSLSAMPEKQDFLLSGIVALGDLYRKQTDIKVTNKELVFNFDDKIKGMLDSKIFGHMSLLDLDAQVEIDVTASFNEFFKERINHLITSIQEKIKELSTALSHLEKDIEIREKRIAEIESIMQTKNNDLQSALNSVQSALTQELARIDPNASQAQRDIDAAVAAVDKAYKDLEHIRRERDNARDRMNKAQGLEKINPGLWAPLIGLEIAVGTAEGVLNAARDVLNNLIRRLADFYFRVGKEVLQGTSDAARIIKNVVANPTQLEQNVELAKLGAELVGLKIARSSVLLARDVPIVVLDQIKDLTTRASDIIKVEKVYFKGSLSQLLKGKFPRFMLDVTILGKKRTLDVQYDIDNAEQSSKEIEKAIAQFFA